MKRKIPFLVCILVLLNGIIYCCVAQPESSLPGMCNTYLLDRVAIAKTPRYLGLNVEVMSHAANNNIWDWLEDSNAGIVRLPHPATILRDVNTQVNTCYSWIKSKNDFEVFRNRINENPEKEIEWSNYLFSTEVPWFGSMDIILDKLKKSHLKSIVAMCYEPSLYPEPLLKADTQIVPVPDDRINWDAAASAYEYYFACIYRCGKLDSQYFMMRNEPSAVDTLLMHDFNVLARMARLAMDDVKEKHLRNKRMQLLGPAVYMAYEEYLHYTKDYIDILDFHDYETSGQIMRNKIRRALMQAREKKLKLSLTEFGRIGGSTDIEESLFGIQPSLQVADLIMNTLSVSGSNDPLFEMALFYQFQFPATHRNYKSLIYGDMNLVDWSGMDDALRGRMDGKTPTLEQLQLRFPTPAYFIFKMLSRCTPGNAESAPAYYPVYELMEANRGVTATKEKRTKRNVWPNLGVEKYYANEGFPYDLKSLVVDTGDRLYINLLNQEPVALKNMRIALSAFPEKYMTAVIRETSLIKKDEPVSQQKIENSIVKLDIPAESFLQIILVKEDLYAISELVMDEHTNTPGSLKTLKMYETVILKTKGRIGNRWIDLSDLNVKYTTDKKNGMTIYSTGLIQRTKESESEGHSIKVDLLDGRSFSFFQ